MGDLPIRFGKICSIYGRPLFQPLETKIRLQHQKATVPEFRTGRRFPCWQSRNPFEEIDEESRGQPISRSRDFEQLSLF